MLIVDFRNKVARHYRCFEDLPGKNQEDKIMEWKCYELGIEGRGTEMRHIEPGEPWDMACKFLLEPCGELHIPTVKALPDENTVVLWEVGREEYLPPRCRKPRTRLVRREIGRWTLGEFRRQ